MSSPMSLPTDEDFRVEEECINARFNCVHLERCRQCRHVGCQPGCRHGSKNPAPLESNEPTSDDLRTLIAHIADSVAKLSRAEAMCLEDEAVTAHSAWRHAHGAHGDRVRKVAMLRRSRRMGVIAMSLEPKRTRICTCVYRSLYIYRSLSLSLSFSRSLYLSLFPSILSLSLLFFISLSLSRSLVLFFSFSLSLSLSPSLDCYLSLSRSLSLPLSIAR